MRKLILIAALLLVSASAQAGQSRGLTLASNDEPQTTEKIETVKPAEAAKPTEAAQPEEAKPEIKAEAKPEAAKPVAAKPAKHVQARHYEGDEAKARRIAARYGVYW
jgi:outer membrane biosynthesis protein TonB